VGQALETGGADLNPEGRTAVVAGSSSRTWLWPRNLPGSTPAG